MTADPDDLAAWLAELRGRVARGELAGREPIAVAGGTLPSVALAARILLADLDHYDDLSLERRRDPLVVARRRVLLEDLRRFRERVG